jgi:hypothetical protein
VIYRLLLLDVGIKAKDHTERDFRVTQNKMPN